MHNAERPSKSNNIDDLLKHTNASSAKSTSISDDSRLSADSKVLHTV